MRLRSMTHKDIHADCGEHCLRVRRRMECPECGYPYSEAIYSLDEAVPHTISRRDLYDVAMKDLFAAKSHIEDALEKAAKMDPDAWNSTYKAQESIERAREKLA